MTSGVMKLSLGERIFSNILYALDSQNNFVTASDLSSLISSGNAALPWEVKGETLTDSSLLLSVSATSDNTGLIVGVSVLGVLLFITLTGIVVYYFLIIRKTYSSFTNSSNGSSIADSEDGRKSGDVDYVNERPATLPHPPDSENLASTMSDVINPSFNTKDRPDHFNTVKDLEANNAHSKEDNFSDIDDDEYGASASKDRKRSIRFNPKVLQIDIDTSDLMEDERVDWVEIIEPKTKEHMYANLTTGECVWDPPEGVNVKRTDSSQWWELFDNNTHRFYYYNATTQTTVWHRPVDCDIIPLAKLQTLKQNTDPQQRRETSTQTIASQPAPQVTPVWEGGGGGVANGVSSGSGSKVSPLGSKNVIHTQTSPLHSRRTHHHRCGAEGRRARGGGVGRAHTDSGRSSDSSISSAAQPYRRLQEAGLAIPVPHHKPDSRLGSEVSMGSLSRGVGSLPASCSTPQLRKKTSQPPHPPHPPPPEPATGLNRSGSFMSPRKDASDDSMHEKYFKSVESTPLTRRKVKQSSGGAATSSCESSPHSPGSPLQPHTPHPSHPQVSGRPSLVSSISLATEHPSQGPAAHAPPSGPCAHAVQQQSLDRAIQGRQYHLHRGARERYSDRHIDKERIEEKLLERNLERGYPSDKQAMYSVDKGFRQTSLEQRPAPAWTPKDITRKQQAEPERHTATKQNSANKQPCSTPDSHSSKSSYHHQDTHPTGGFGLKSLSLEPHLTKPNIERHNMELERERERERIKDRDRDRTRDRDRDRSNNENTEKEPRQRGPRKQKVSTAMDTLESDGGCENGNTSPLYSNWDLHMQHLLPLQHYILEQAKLSGCYRVGDPLEAGSADSDSLHSSGSSSGARSLSGHEPDNEDSDRSGSNDTYLQHQPPPAPLPPPTHRHDEYMNHGVSYYNTFIGFEKEREPAVGVHRSASGTGMGMGMSGGLPLPLASTTPHSLAHAPLPCEALYSPVKSHPALHLTSKETDIEKFAQDNLNLHSKGIFRKKASVRDMLSWTCSGISQPMLGDRRDKAYKKAAAEIFRLVQIYMGDRKARPGMTLNSVAIDILHAAYTNPALRDELYVQLCRQTTENPQRDSLLRGWELLAVSLAFVPPSPAFQPPLLNYMNRHRDPAFADTFPEVGKWPIHVQVSHYAGVACRRLERIGQCGKKQPRKPNTEDIDQARIQIFRTSMFGNTLSEVMVLQKDRFPNRQLPWVQVALSQQVFALQGKQTEGIFRVSADVDEVTVLKARLDNWELPDHLHITDAHAPASLLKLWYRELYEPLIPDTLYAECVADPDNTDNAFDIIQRLPRINRLVLTYLVGFLQQFSTPEVVTQTKMDSANLAMVFAPNCLRCTSQDPRVILDNARKEMTFMRCLILNMDTEQFRDML